MNIGTVFTEIATAVKAGDTDILSQISTMTGNLAKKASIPQLLIEGGELLATVAEKYPDPKVQLVAQLASAILSAIAPSVTPATAT